MKVTLDKAMRQFFWFSFSCGVVTTIFVYLVWLLIKAKLAI